MENRRSPEAERVRYHSTCKLRYHVDTGSYLASGIAACDSSGCLVAAIEDVSLDHAWVEELVLRLNRGQADPAHLCDIVFDAVFGAGSV